MASHSSTLAWKTPWTEEPGRLQSMEGLSKRKLHRIDHTDRTDLMTTQDAKSEKIKSSLCLVFFCFKEIAREELDRKA